PTWVSVSCRIRMLLLCPAGPACPAGCPGSAAGCPGPPDLSSVATSPVSPRRPPGTEEGGHPCRCPPSCEAIPAPRPPLCGSLHSLCWPRVTVSALATPELLVGAHRGLLSRGERLLRRLLPEQRGRHRVLDLGLDLLTGGRGAERLTAGGHLVVGRDRLVEAVEVGVEHVLLADRLVGLGRPG